MNSTHLTLTGNLLRSLCICALAALLCSCAATKVKKTWKSPELQQPVGKLAVLAVEERGLLRQGLENRFAAQISRAGSPAMVTFDQLSLEEIKQDKQSAAERFRTNGAEALLILRLVDIGGSYRDIQPGGERYAGTITGVETMGWYDYYSVGFMSMSPTYGSMKQRVYLETSVYNLKSEKRLWSVLTETVVTENMDRLAELDPLVQKIVENMRKEGVIP